MAISRWLVAAETRITFFSLLEEKGFILVFSSGSQSLIVGEAVIAGTWDSRSHHIHRQEQREDERLLVYISLSLLYTVPRKGATRFSLILPTLANIIRNNSPQTSPQATLP